MRSHFERLFAIDLRTLAIVRIGLGAVLLLDLFYRSTNLEAFYTDAGVLPRESLRVLDADGLRLWSLHALGDGPVFQGTLFIAQGAVAIAVLVGSWTRLAMPLAWLLLVSLQHRNPLILTGADQVLRAMLLWGCLLPLGARWSLDAKRRGAPSSECASPWAGIPLLAQIPLLYVFSVIFKLRSDSWTELTAFSEIARVEGVATEWARILAQHDEFASTLTAATLALELLGPLLAFSPWRTAGLRIAMVSAFILLHAVGIGSTLRLGLMPVVMSVFWLPMLPSAFWNGLLRARGEVTGPGMRAPALVVAAGLAFFGVAVAENLRSLDLRRAPPPLPGGVSSLSAAFALEQRWQLWDRPIANRFYVLAATLRDGSEVDLRTGRALDWSQPARRSRNNQWWKLELQLSAPAAWRLRREYVGHLARCWNRRRPPERHVVEAAFVRLDARRAGNPATLPRHVLWEGRIDTDPRETGRSRSAEGQRACGPGSQIAH